eukprot:6318808-Amphidinium_carterae.1
MQQAVLEGRVSADADAVANLGAAEHDPHEPSKDELHWVAISEVVRDFWVLVDPKLRKRPEVCPIQGLAAGAGA